MYMKNYLTSLICLVHISYFYTLSYYFILCSMHTITSLSSYICYINCAYYYSPESINIYQYIYQFYPCNALIVQYILYFILYILQILCIYAINYIYLYYIMKRRSYATLQLLLGSQLPMLYSNLKEISFFFALTGLLIRKRC